MKTAKLLVRGLLLTIIYLFLFATISAFLIPPLKQNAAPDEGALVLAALLVVSFSHTVVLSYLIVRANIYGLELIAYIFVVLFGVSTIMSQMETAVFVTHLPPGFLSRIVLSGLLLALVFSAIAVVIWGKLRRSRAVESNWLNLTWKEWTIRLAIIGCCYVIIYFTFGYYLAWKNPAVQTYYGGTDPGDFFSQIKSVLRDTPWLPIFQFARGILWTLIALPIIKMMKGKWWETALGVSLCFALLMSPQLLIPNPLMPVAVRQAHFVETITSNFLFGWLVVFVLVKWRSSQVWAQNTRAWQ